MIQGNEGFIKMLTNYQRQKICEAAASGVGIKLHWQHGRKKNSI